MEADAVIHRGVVHGLAAERIAPSDGAHGQPHEVRDGLGGERFMQQHNERALVGDEPGVELARSRDLDRWKVHGLVS